MMHRILSLFALLAVVCAITFIASAPAVPTAHAATIVTAATAGPEAHPEIREAIAALHRAKDHMEHAAHDFGGHRVEALKATDEAIRQLDICLKYDK